MVKTKSTKISTRRLDQQVRLLKRKEESAKKQLKKAFNKAQALAKSYEKKLSGYYHRIKAMLVSAEESPYFKSAAKLTRSLRKKAKGLGKEKVVKRSVPKKRKAKAKRSGTRR